MFQTPVSSAQPQAVLLWPPKGKKRATSMKLGVKHRLIPHVDSMEK